MNFDSISGLMGTLGDLLDGDNTPQHSSQKKEEGYNLLQPLMQNFLDKNDDTPANTKVEDLDDDGIMDVLGGLGKNMNIAGLLQNLDPNQITSVISFVQETFMNSSHSKQKEHAGGLASLLGSVQDMEIDTDVITNALGGFLNRK